MSKPSHREKLLDAGLRQMFRTGYVGSSVREITTEAGAPLGSFTNHFRSKEAFASEVLARYFEHVKALIAATLGDRSVSPAERLRRYFDAISGRLAEDQFMRGCLIGDFSLEAPFHSDKLRDQLSRIYMEWRQPFAACIAEGQAAGEITDTFKPDDLAEYLIASWEGAILRMKVERHPAALERFKRIAFTTLFPSPQPSQNNKERKP